MTENTKYFSQKFTYYIDKLKAGINLLKENNEQETIENDVFSSLLNRIYIHLDSAYLLSKSFEERNISSSIALLFRSCISDMIFGFYLLLHLEDKNSFDSEIKIKDAEFLKYVLKVSPLEQKILSKKSHDFIEREKEIIKIILQNYSDLLISNGATFSTLKIKTTKEIREEYNSSKEILGQLYNKHLTEENIFSILMEKNPLFENYYLPMYSHWKFYSQFQHFSYSSKDFINDDKKNFLYYFLSSLKDIYFFTHTLSHQVYNFQIEDLDKELMHLIKDLEDYPNHFKE